MCVSARRAAHSQNIDVKTAFKDSRYHEVLLSGSATSFSIRVKAQAHTNLRLTTVDEVCDLIPGERHPTNIPFSGDKAKFAIIVDEGGAILH